MKNIKQYIMLAATLLVAGCSQDEELVEAPAPGQGDWVEITVGAPQEQHSRVSYDDTSLTPFAWEADDAIIAVGFGPDGAYKGQEVFAMKGELPADKTKATFVGRLSDGATSYKLYYKAAHLTISEAEGAQGAPLIDYSTQTENVTSAETQTAHMKDFYLLGTEAIPAADMLDASKAKTLNLLNSLLRLEVKAMPTNMGVLESITLTTNHGTTEAQSAALAISNATAETQSLVAYMLFNPEILKQEANKEFVLTLTGNEKVFLHSKTTTKAAFNQSGYRYRLTVDDKTEWTPKEVVVTPSKITTSKAGAIAAAMIAQAVGDTKKLAIVGPINGQDMRVIREAAGCVYNPRDLGNAPDPATVTDLDLSGASIKASEDVYCKNMDEVDCKITADHQIGDFMFAGAQLTSITLPNTITAIGAEAFKYCESLATITFEAGGTEPLTIGFGAFSESGVTAMKIPKRTTTIGDGAFDMCGTLATLTFEAGGTEPLTIGEHAFSGLGVTAVDIPKRTTIIGNSAFNNCRTLATLTFEAGGTEPLSIERNAFNLAGVTAVDIPSRTTAITGDPFFECSNLTTITLHTPYSEDAKNNINFLSNFGEDYTGCVLNLDSSWQTWKDQNPNSKNLFGVTWNAINVASAPAPVQ